MIRRMPERPPEVTDRWRDIAGAVGHLPPGERNAITDVPGVRVGHSQAQSGQRTGVTVVAPPDLPALAGTAVVNGTGELTSKLEIDETGLMDTPVYLCGTHALGTVYQAAIMASGRGPQHVVIPVVGETDDGDMADSRTVVAADVDAATAALGAEVAEGSVGAGTGMQLYEFPGGIGTASRRVGEWHVGVLLQCNFGEREYLDLLGHTLEPAARPAVDNGSCIAVCATDAPLTAQQLKRLALRPLLGLARTGSYGSEGSGEIGLALSTVRGGSLGNGDLNPIFAAAYESAHEAVMNCLVAAAPAERLDGSMQDAFPVERARELARR
jgi:D-aminopeptidase